MLGLKNGVTFFLFAGMLVGTNMFEEIYLQRLPAHHAYNGLDAEKHLRKVGETFHLRRSHERTGDFEEL
jgi:hypothetical protein